LMAIFFGYARCEITLMGSVPMGGYVAREGPSVGLLESLKRNLKLREEIAGDT
jgi:hypothetical protein